MPTTVPNTQTGTLTGHQHGSDDTLLGVDDATNVLFGDAFAMDDHAVGGNDTLTRGSSLSADTSNTLYGDAFDMTDHALGGNDTLFGGANLSTASTVTNVLFGDAFHMDDHATGGADTLTGGDNASRGEFDTSTTTNTLYGDAIDMHDFAVGGDNILVAGRGAPGNPFNATNTLFGDANTMSDNAAGGGNTLLGGSFAINLLTGDAGAMHDNARGGHNTLDGGTSSFNVLEGDAGTMDGNASGGGNTLTGGSGKNVFGGGNLLYGDAQTMRDNASGGGNTLTGGNEGATMVGDAQSMFDNTVGGNNVLIGSPGALMWGAAQFIDGVAASPTAPTGNVVLGADTFVFGPHSGNDTVFDFRQSNGDKIDVSAFGFHSLADMTITGNGTDTTVAFDASDSVTLVGIADPNSLQASAFIFDPPGAATTGIGQLAVAAQANFADIQPSGDLGAALHKTDLFGST
jgi:hypothetical protein